MNLAYRTLYSSSNWGDSSRKGKYDRHRSGVIVFIGRNVMFRQDVHMNGFHAMGTSVSGGAIGYVMLGSAGNLCAGVQTPHSFGFGGEFDRIDGSS